uniref:Variant surface glycoprotein 1125.5527 n=1 Tax=Trypanosoma brucei TaxID=5691 RepID=A0A1J0RCJ8_9TRYP|nr:variant surface glycoprotein 1125.5527 [Trypanosoma brucei]
MMCICAKTNTNGKEKPCTSTSEDSTEVSGSFANLGTLLTTLVGNCPERDKRTLTGSEIRQALADFKATATRSGSQTVFGKFVATNCHGSSNSGQCVLYSGNVATAKSAIDGSKWSTQLTAAADTIDAITKHNEKVSQAQERIRQAKEAVMTIMRLPLMPHSTPGMAKNSKTTPAATDAEANQKKCDQHHNNQTECEKLKCSYDANAEEGKKCKPKETGTEDKPKEREHQEKIGVQNTELIRQNMILKKQAIKKIVHLEIVKIMNLIKKKETCRFPASSSIKNWTRCLHFL